MARPGKIARLPSATRGELGRRRAEGATLDELVRWLDDEGFKVGRTAVFKHVRTLATAVHQIQLSRQRAEALITLAEQGDLQSLQKLNVELLQGLIMGVLAKVADGQAPLTSRDIKQLAEALARLATAARLAQDRAGARRISATAATVREAAKAPGQGLSPEAIERIRATVLGIGAGAAVPS